MPESTNTGGRKPRVTDDDLLDVFRATADPVLSTAEVADAVPIKRRGTLNRLRDLEDGGRLDSKQIGGRNTVWWLLDDAGQPPTNSDAVDDGVQGTVDTSLADDHAPDADPDAAGPPVDIDSLSLDRDLTPERREELGAWLRYVRDADGGVTKSDFESWWTDDRAERSGYNAGSFWEAFAKASMKQSDKFDKPNSRTYRWRGDAVEDSGVYDPTKEFDQ